jgi:uncharacterized OB-fold protein
MAETSTDTGRRPRPARHPATDFFWAAARDHRLDMLRCDDCGTYIHPPRPVCRSCLSTSLHPSQVSGEGTLYSYTVSGRGPHPWLGGDDPYALVTVELVEQPGLRMVSNLVGQPTETIRTGMPLRVDFIDVDEELSLPVFRAAEGRL